MMQYGWLTVIGALVLLAGCAELPCKPPGEKDDTGPCSFLLTITKTNPEVRGHVAKAAVELNTWGQQKKYETTDLKTSAIRSYQFIEYPLHVSSKDKETLIPGKDYLFVRQPGTSLLQLIENEVNLPPHENAPPAKK